MVTARAEAEATAQLAALNERRARAAARVSDLEQEWRSAVAAARDASAALAEGERQGLSTTKRHALEGPLRSAGARQTSRGPSAGVTQFRDSGGLKRPCQAPA